MAVRRARGAPSARRSHQQHFLRSTRLAAEIVCDAGVGRDHVVLDIGAGEGMLTAELAKRAGRVRAIELDPRLAAQLRRRFAATGNVEVVLGDAVGVALPVEPFRVVANIPFNRTTAIMRRLLDDPRTGLVQADLVVELDAAWKRARCVPSTALGSYWGAWYEFAIVRRLDATAFRPPPRTHAAVLRITRREHPLVPHEHAPSYRTLIEHAFARQSLRSVVSSLQLKRLARELGFGPDAPPSELDPHQWSGVFRFVRTDR